MINLFTKGLTLIILVSLMLTSCEKECEDNYVIGSVSVWGWDWYTFEARNDFKNVFKSVTLLYLPDNVEEGNTICIGDDAYKVIDEY